VKKLCILCTLVSLALFAAPALAKKTREQRCQDTCNRVKEQIIKNCNRMEASDAQKEKCRTTGGQKMMEECLKVCNEPKKSA